MPEKVYVAVRDVPIDAGAESATISAAMAGTAGAAACFIGAVRGGEVRALTLEHYPEMTESALQQIAREAAKKWQLTAARIIHRIGKMKPGDIIVFVGASSAHRGAAFAACEFMTDHLKTRAPFWKKEETANGESRWVCARAEDKRAQEKWTQSP